MPWDDLVSAANKAEARAKIQGSTHLDQRCPRGKRPLKMSLNSRDEQPERAQKSGTTPQGPQGKANQAEQGSEAEKSSEKARRDKKKKAHRGRRDRRENREGSTPATGSNTEPPAGTKRKDPSQITCYNCNKKGHISKECTEPKKTKN